MQTRSRPFSKYASILHLLYALAVQIEKETNNNTALCYKKKTHTTPNYLINQFAFFNVPKFFYKYIFHLFGMYFKKYITYIVGSEIILYK